MPSFVLQIYLPETAQDVKQIIQTVADALYDGNESMAVRRIVRDFAADRKINVTPEPEAAPATS